MSDYKSRREEAAKWAKERKQRDPPWQQAEACIFCGDKCAEITLYDGTPMDACASCAPFVEMLVEHVYGAALRLSEEASNLISRAQREEDTSSRQTLYGAREKLHHAVDVALGFAAEEDADDDVDDSGDYLSGEG